jgi:LPXTG-motif cell wall-anchored protein
MNSQDSTATSTQGAASDQTTPGAAAPNNDQNAGAGASGANSNQNAGQTSATTSDQNGNQVRHISDMDQNGTSGQNSKLPQTASPLPLLGLLGLGSLGAGLFGRRKK